MQSPTGIGQHGRAREQPVQAQRAPDTSADDAILAACMAYVERHCPHATEVDVCLWIGARRTARDAAQGGHTVVRGVVLTRDRNMRVEARIAGLAVRDAASLARWAFEGDT